MFTAVTKCNMRYGAGMHWECISSRFQCNARANSRLLCGVGAGLIVTPSPWSQFKKTKTDKQHAILVLSLWNSQMTTEHILFNMFWRYSIPKKSIMGVPKESAPAVGTVPQEKTEQRGVLTTLLPLKKE